MALILLKKAKTNTGVCRSCGAPVDWYTTPAGKAMPMNAGARPVHEDPDSFDPPFATFHTDDTHWATCPNAGAWKTQKAPV